LDAGEPALSRNRRRGGFLMEGLDGGAGHQHAIRLAYASTVDPNTEADATVLIVIAQMMPHAVLRHGL